MSGDNVTVVRRKRRLTPKQKAQIAADRERVMDQVAAMVRTAGDAEARRRAARWIIEFGAMTLVHQGEDAEAGAAEAGAHIVSIGGRLLHETNLGRARP